MQPTMAIQGFLVDAPEMCSGGFETRPYWMPVPDQVRDKLSPA
jgi:hypothetical protein